MVWQVALMFDPPGFPLACRAFLTALVGSRVRTEIHRLGLLGRFLLARLFVGILPFNALLAGPIAKHDQAAPGGQANVDILVRKDSDQFLNQRQLLFARHISGGEADFRFIALEGFLNLRLTLLGKLANQRDQLPLGLKSSTEL